LVKRSAVATAKALDGFAAELKRLGKDKERAIVRFHTDVDKSFLGAVEKLVIPKGWKQTDTGGYKSAANGIVERRIGMLKEAARTEMVAATGGDPWYHGLWGHTMVRANFTVNVNDWASGRVSPHEQLTGQKYVWTARDHVFCEYCTWGVPKANRSGPYQGAAEQGIWVRRDDTSTKSAVVVPIHWNVKQQQWV
jgi:hypothetical protein